MTAEDVRECPATYALAASWILVFALMHLVQRGQVIAPEVGAQIGPGAIVTTTSHRFGDMTWREVRRGEAWRAVTATFVHYSLLHLGLNLVGLVKLGRLIEPWYGPGPFLGVCLAIGGLGNLVGGLLRQGAELARAWALGSGLARAWPALFAKVARGGASLSDQVHSGGGSTILLGLIGLCAVVGWRSRTRIGASIRDEMVSLLAFTALLGLLLPNLVDNFGHAGGAAAGLAIGFAHRPLVRLRAAKGFGRLAAAGSMALVAGCLVAAARDDRSEAGLAGAMAAARARYADDQRWLGDLERIYVLVGRSARLDAGAGGGETGGELDRIAMDDLFPLEPAMTADIAAGTPDEAQLRLDRAELLAIVDRLGDPAADPEAARLGAGAVADLGVVLDLAREAGRATPAFDRAYRFLVAWKAAARAILGDRAAAQSDLIGLDRRAATDR